jgi:hypothetical protein
VEWLLADRVDSGVRSHNEKFGELRRRAVAGRVEDSFRSQPDGSNGESLSTRQVSQLNDQRVDACTKVVASERTSWQAHTAAIREFPNLETKMDGVVFNGAVDRTYVSDRTVTPAHSVNREAL